jgi:hypothetical protein
MNQKKFVSLVRDDMVSNSTWSKIAEFCFYSGGVLSYVIHQEKNYYTQIDIITEGCLRNNERPISILTSERVYYCNYSVCMRYDSGVSEILYTIEYKPILNK